MIAALGRKRRWAAAAASVACAAYGQADAQPAAQEQPPPVTLGAPAAADPQKAPEPELPAFLDDRRLRELETVTKPRQDAIDQRRADKLKRKAIEEDLKRKAEEMRRSVEGETASQSGQPAAKAPAEATLAPKAGGPAAPGRSETARAPADAAPQMPQVLRAGAAAVLSPAQAQAARPATPCRPGETHAAPLPGGRVQIDVADPCRANQSVTIGYAPYVFVRQLSAEGRLSFVLDLFQGAAQAPTLLYADGESRSILLPPTDLESVSKVAIVWGKPVNVDLHAFEYSAKPGGPGHVWAGNPSGAEAARDEARRSGRGRGFISFTSDGSVAGHQIEVYTFWHQPGQPGGLVSTAIDYETRNATPAGDTCGSGPFASFPFETVSLAPGRTAIRERGIISPVPCGEPLIEKARYLDEAVPDVLANNR